MFKSFLSKTLALRCVKSCADIVIVDYFPNILIVYSELDNMTGMCVCALFRCWMVHLVLTNNLSRYAIAMQFCTHWEPSSKRQLVCKFSLVQSDFVLFIFVYTHI